MEFVSENRLGRHLDVVTALTSVDMTPKNKVHRDGDHGKRLEQTDKGCGEHSNTPDEKFSPDSEYVNSTPTADSVLKKAGPSTTMSKTGESRLRSPPRAPTSLCHPKADNKRVSKCVHPLIPRPPCGRKPTLREGGCFILQLVAIPVAKAV